MPHRVEASGAQRRRPEEALLLWCASPAARATRAAPLTALVHQDLDWAALIRMAQWHGLLPLLYTQLQTTCPDAVPAALWQPLRARFEANAAHNLRLTAALLALLREFARHGVPVVPFKGPVLAATAYHNLALRQFGDLDLLVQPQDMPRVKALLLDCGYQPALALTPTQEAAMLPWYNERTFLHPDTRVALDVHWSLHRHFWPTPHDPASLWERLVPVTLGGQEVWTFTPEDTLVVLCGHGARHVWYRLLWLSDIAWLLEATPHLDWARVTAQAQGGRRMLWLGLRLIHELLAVPLPEAMRHQVQADPQTARLIEVVSQVLFATPPVVPLGFSNLWFRYRVLETLGSRSALLYHSFCTPDPADLTWLPMSLPTALFPLYSVLRLIRLSGTYLAGFLQRLWGRTPRGRHDGAGLTP